MILARCLVREGEFDLADLVGTGSEQTVKWRWGSNADQFLYQKVRGGISRAPSTCWRRWSLGPMPDTMLVAISSRRMRWSCTWPRLRHIGWQLTCSDFGVLNLPYINPLDKTVWANLQAWVNPTSYPSIARVKASIQQHWDQMPEPNVKKWF